MILFDRLSQGINLPGVPGVFITVSLKLVKPTPNN